MKSSIAPTKKGILKLFFITIAASITLVSCAHIRQFTYPKSFTWIGEEDVSNAMRSMARNIEKLDKLIIDETQRGQNRDTILQTLGDIEYTAAELSIRTPIDEEIFLTTNHLLIDEHIEDFLEDILQAKIQIQSSPTNYYKVGQLTGSCMACHRFR